MKTEINCIVCKQEIDQLPVEEQNHPLDATAFQSGGHYGSSAFDPMDGTYLEINVCDDCLRAAGKDGNVLVGFPRPAPPRGPMMKWPMADVESDDS